MIIIGIIIIAGVVLFISLFSSDNGNKRNEKTDKYYRDVHGLNDNEIDEVKKGNYNVESFEEEDLEEDDYYFDDDDKNE